MTTIYTISVSGEVVYVGKTENIQARIKAHRNGKFKDVDFVFEELESFELGRSNNEIISDYVEEYWIHQFSSWGFNLINKRSTPSYSSKRDLFNDCMFGSKGFRITVLRGRDYKLQPKTKI